MLRLFQNLNHTQDGVWSFPNNSFDKPTSGQCSQDIETSLLICSATNWVVSMLREPWLTDALQLSLSPIFEDAESYPHFTAISSPKEVSNHCFGWQTNILPLSVFNVLQTFLVLWILLGDFRQSISFSNHSNILL